LLAHEALVAEKVTNRELLLPKKIVDRISRIDLSRAGIAAMIFARSGPRGRPGKL